MKIGLTVLEQKIFDVDIKWDTGGARRPNETDGQEGTTVREQAWGRLRHGGRRRRWV